MNFWICPSDRGSLQKKFWKTKIVRPCCQLVMRDEWQRLAHIFPELSDWANREAVVSTAGIMNVFTTRVAVGDVLILPSPKGLGVMIGKVVGELESDMQGPFYPARWTCRLSTAAKLTPDEIGLLRACCWFENLTDRSEDVFSRIQRKIAAYAARLVPQSGGLVAVEKEKTPADQRPHQADDDVPRLHYLKDAYIDSIHDLALAAISELTDFQKGDVLRADYALEDLPDSLLVTSPASGILTAIKNGKLSLHDLHWKEFEDVICELLRKEGFEFEPLKRTKDDGIDIIARKNVAIIGPVVTVWQAKRWKHKVGRPDVKLFSASVDHYEADRGIIVTTADFTKGALAWIQEYERKLQKRNHDDMMKWISGS